MFTHGWAKKCESNHRRIYSIRKVSRARNFIGFSQNNLINYLLTPAEHHALNIIVIKATTDVTNENLSHQKKNGCKNTKPTLEYFINQQKQTEQIISIQLKLSLHRYHK